MNYSAEVLRLQDCLAAFRLYVSDGFETALHWYPDSEAFLVAHAGESIDQVERFTILETGKLLTPALSALRWE